MRTGELQTENDNYSGLSWHRKLRGRSLLIQFISVLTFLSGCYEQVTSSPVSVPTKPSPTKPRTLRILVLDDPPLAKAIADEWNTRAEIQLKVVEETSDVCITMLEEKRPFDSDIIVYPAYWMGELVQRERILPVPLEVLNDRTTEWQDVLPLVRQRELTWGTQVYALSLGSSHYVLYYRPEIFAQLDLSPPSTWEEYAQVADQLASLGKTGFTADVPGDPWYAVAEPWGPGWSGTTLLARAAGYAKHRNNYSTLFRYKTMEPLINGPPFVRALEELLAVAPFAPANASKLTPRGIFDLFKAGHCAMAISWPTNRQSAASDLTTDKFVSTAIAELPGSKEVYHIQDKAWQQRKVKDDFRVVLLGVAGRLVSVTDECRSRRTAFRLLMFLTGSELGGIIAPHSDATTVYRQSQLTNPSAWFPSSTPSSVTRQYGELVETMQTRVSSLSPPRIPGRARYMEALDNAVHQALVGNLSAQEALDEAATQWREITSSHGIEAQSVAYRRSLGLDF